MSENSKSTNLWNALSDAYNNPLETLENWAESAVMAGSEFVESRTSDPLLLIEDVSSAFTLTQAMNSPMSIPTNVVPQAVSHFFSKAVTAALPIQNANDPSQMKNSTSWSQSLWDGAAYLVGEENLTATANYVHSCVDPVVETISRGTQTVIRTFGFVWPHDEFTTDGTQASDVFLTSAVTLFPPQSSAHESMRPTSSTQVSTSTNEVLRPSINRNLVHNPIATPALQNHIESSGPNNGRREISISRVASRDSETSSTIQSPTGITKPKTETLAESISSRRSQVSAIFSCRAEKSSHVTRSSVAARLSLQTLLSVAEAKNNVAPSTEGKESESLMLLAEYHLEYLESLLLDSEVDHRVAAPSLQPSESRLSFHESTVNTPIVFPRTNHPGTEFQNRISSAQTPKDFETRQNNSARAFSANTATTAGLTIQTRNEASSLATSSRGQSFLNLSTIPLSTSVQVPQDHTRFINGALLSVRASESQNEDFRLLENVSANLSHRTVSVNGKSSSSSDQGQSDSQPDWDMIEGLEASDAQMVRTHSHEDVQNTEDEFPVNSDVFV